MSQDQNQFPQPVGSVGLFGPASAPTLARPASSPAATAAVIDPKWAPDKRAADPLGPPIGDPVPLPPADEHAPEPEDSSKAVVLAIIGCILALTVAAGVAAVLQPWRSTSKPPPTGGGSVVAYAAPLAATSTTVVTIPVETSTTGLAAAVLDTNDVAPLSKAGVTATWVSVGTADDQSMGALVANPCAPTSGPTTWAQSQLALVDSQQGIHGEAVSSVMHFETAAQAEQYVDARRTPEFVACEIPKITLTEEAQTGGHPVGAPTMTPISGVDGGPAYRYDGMFAFDGRQCPEFEDDFWAVVGTDAISAQFDVCTTPWSARSEHDILAHELTEVAPSI